MTRRSTAGVDTRDDGTKVIKFDAPKATLMALIIDGIMTGKLPWGLVLLGVFIAVVMQLAGVPALAFAVGVYLPLSTRCRSSSAASSARSVDRIKRTPPEESDSSPAVLLSSGYIAGRRDRGHPLRRARPLPERPGARSTSPSRLPAWWNESRLAVARPPSASPSLILGLVGTGHLLRGGGVPEAVEEGLTAREEDL